MAGRKSRPSKRDEHTLVALGAATTGASTWADNQAWRRSGAAMAEVVVMDSRDLRPAMTVGGKALCRPYSAARANGAPAVKAVLTARAALAASYSLARRATSSPAVGIDLTAPMPWPQPQISRQALAS